MKIYSQARGAGKTHALKDYLKNDISNTLTLELIAKIEQTRIDNENYIKVLNNYFDLVKENKELRENKHLQNVIDSKNGDYKRLDKKYNELLEYSNRIYSKLVRLENENR